MDNVLLNQSERPTKTHYRILIMSWAGWAFDFYDLILYTFLLIPIGVELNLDDITLSFVLGASLAATAIGGVIFGFLSDRYGRKSVLQWTILIYSIGTFLSGLSFNIFSLVVFRIITGLGVGGEWATGQTYIGETFPAKMRGKYCAFMQTGAPIGVALASVVGGLIAPIIGWRESFFISVIPALLIVFIRKHLPESDLWTQRKKMLSEKTVSETIRKKETANKFLLLFSKGSRRLFIQALILAVFDMSAYWYTYSWLPGYLHQQRHFSMSKSAMWMLVTQTGGFIGYFLFGYIADHLGRRPAYSIYSVVMACGLIMITIMWNQIVAYPALILFFMFVVGFGTGMFGGFGSLFSEIFPTAIRNTAMGTAFNLARGVQFFTPVIIAVVATQYGLAGGISIAAFFALLTGAWIWTFPETKGKVLSVVNIEKV